MTTTMMLLIVAAAGVGDGLGLGLGPGFMLVLTPPHPIAASIAMPKKKPMVRVNVCHLRLFRNSLFESSWLAINRFLMSILVELWN